MKPAISTAIITSTRSPPFGRRVQASTAAAMEAAPMASASSMRAPPAAQASFTGGIETSTAASPPSAVKPTMPTLNSPA